MENFDTLEITTEEKKIVKKSQKMSNDYFEICMINNSTIIPFTNLQFNVYNL